MKINIKIAPPDFIALAQYAHSIRHYIETTQDVRGFIPRWKWTVDTFADKIPFKSYQTWRNRKAHKAYNFDLTICAALALLEGLQSESVVSHEQQNLINLLYQILINKHFSPESLNLKFSQPLNQMPMT